MTEITDTSASLAEKNRPKRTVWETRTHASYDGATLDCTFSRSAKPDEDETNGMCEATVSAFEMGFGYSPQSVRVSTQIRNEEV